MPTEIVIQDQLYKLFGNGDEDLYDDIVAAVDDLVEAEVGILPALTAAAVAAAPSVTFTQTYSTTAATVPAATAVAVATTAATNSSPYGYAGAAQADAIVTAVNALIADCLALRKTQNQIIDVLQAAGFAL